MYTYSEQATNQLNGILEKNFDAAKGYKTAAENASNRTLTHYFDKKANERTMFSNQLKSEITKYFDAEPNDSGSIAGMAHRTWMDTKAMFASDNDEAMLEEAIRGEKASIDEYNEVLNAKNMILPNTTKSLLENQRNTILKDTNVIKTLEDLK